MKSIDFANFRYEGETALVRELEDGFALKNYYTVFNNEEDCRKLVNSYLSHGVRLNEIIAPRLYDLCKKAKEKIGYEEEIEFFVVSDVNFNAYAINGFGYVPHLICFTSGLIQNFSDEELLFVIGHEIGHLMFTHSQINLVMFYIKNPDKPLPMQLTNLYYRWRKYAEISSDRMGFIAQPNLEIIGKVFFKFASGLSEQHLNFNIKEYMKQLDRIQGMSAKEFYASHPINLIRLKCLELFSQSEYYTEGSKCSFTKETLLNQMITSLNMLERHPQNDYQRNALEFFVACGMYIAGADKTMNPSERSFLYELVANFTSQPEIYLKFKDFNEVIERKNIICEYYSNSQNDSKFELLSKLALLAHCDGRLEESEMNLLYEIADRVKIEKRIMNDMIMWAAGIYGVKPGENPSGMNDFFN